MESNDIIQFISDGFEKAKSGQALDVYAEVAAIQDNNRLPLKSHYAFGWIIYYALHQSAGNAIKERKRMLFRYLKLDVPRPHKLHSMILTEAIRLYKDVNDSSPTTFSLVKFTELWGLANLRPGDWNRKEFEGKEMSATVEKLVTHITDELYSTQTEPDKEFMAVADKALKTYTGSANLYSQYSRLSELLGEPELALDMLKRAVIIAPSKFFLWDRLATLVNDQRRLRISLLVKALSCNGPEQFKGKVRLHLAEALCDASAYPQALWELNTVHELYTTNSWNMPRLYRDLVKKIPTGTLPANPTKGYSSLASLAEDYIFDSLPAIVAVKSYHKTTPADPRIPEGEVAWRATDGAGNNYWFNPARYNIYPDMPMGTRLKVKIYDGKVVRVILD